MRAKATPQQIKVQQLAHVTPKVVEDQIDIQKTFNEIKDLLNDQQRISFQKIILKMAGLSEELLTLTVEILKAVNKKTKGN